MEIMILIYTREGDNLNALTNTDNTYQQSMISKTIIRTF